MLAKLTQVFVSFVSTSSSSSGSKIKLTPSSCCTLHPKMSVIISGSFHHLKTCLGIRASLTKLLTFHSPKRSHFPSTRLLTTRAELTHERPHSNPPHSINIHINKTNLVHHQQIESIRCYEGQNGKTDWPATFLVLDLETTGFNRETHRIIEVAIRDCSGGDNSTFESLVNPKRFFTNSHIHGITSRMVNRPNVPTLKELIPILLEFVKSRRIQGKPVVLIAHNGKSFDFPFLKIQMRICGFDIPNDWLFLDSLNLAKQCTNIKGSRGLNALKEYYNIMSDGPAHRAMADVNVLCQLIERFTFELKKTPLDLLEDSFTADQINSGSKTD
ncbi:hypothetical protein LUZ60_013879 [Juncus effusus]|nr:hypothetical protein LUZ60_013879 [Juncus effusus]